MESDFQLAIAARSGLAALGLAIVLATPLLAQRPSPPPPLPRRPNDLGSGQSTLLDPGNAPARPGVEAPPASATEPRVSLAELKKDIDQLQALNAKLRQAIDSGSASDFGKLGRYVEEIQELAWRLKTTGYWSAGDRSGSDGRPAPPAPDQQLSGLAFSLSEAITAFLSNPVVQQSRIVDAELLAQAGEDLETIIRQAAVVRKRADELDHKDVGTKTRHKRPRYLQFTLDCQAWAADLFADQAARVETLLSLDIEGVTVRVKRHKLLTEQPPVFIGQCMIPAIDENAAGDDGRYAAIVKEFNSYEVKGRAFAYQAHYQIVQTKNGRIIKRMDQPLVLYFTDEGGGGLFELYEGRRPLRSLPDWVKDLVGRH